MAMGLCGFGTMALWLWYNGYGFGTMAMWLWDNGYVALGQWLWLWYKTMALYGYGKMILIVGQGLEFMIAFGLAHATVSKHSVMHTRSTKGVPLEPKGSHGRGPTMGGEPLGTQRIPWEGTLGSPRDPIYLAVTIYRSA